MINSLKILCYLMLLISFSTYSPKIKEVNKSFLFPIKYIEIENIKIVNKKQLLIDLQTLEGTSLLFLNYEILKKNLELADYISSFKIKKIYPNKIKIYITEKSPVAIYIDGKKKFYISERGDFMQYKPITELVDLPIILGKNMKFGNFFNDLKIIKFPLDKVKSYQYFAIGRWDIILKNKKIIKLPQNNYISALKNFVKLQQNKNFQNYQIFDFRIKDQLILK